MAVSAELAAAPAVGNEVLLRQAVVNLLQNAVRHNLPSGGRVELTTGPDPEQPGRVRLTVRNSGPVLEGSVVATLTEPFLRGGGRTAQRGPVRRGHGLGLAIVAAVTEAHGGQLRLAGNPDGGLTAVLSLPGRAGSGAADPAR